MRRSLVILSALLLVASAGCGDDDHAAHEAEENSQTTTGAGSDTTGGTDAEPGDDGGDTAEPSGDHEHHNADFPAAEATDIAKISMRDYAFVDLPATVTGPKLRIEAKNNGPSAHEIVIFDADGNEAGGIEPIPSGDSADVSLELTAGTYELRCQIAISETETHLDRGMKAVFQVM